MRLRRVGLSRSESGYRRLAGQLRGVIGMDYSFLHGNTLRSRTNPQQHAYQLTLDEFEQIVELLPSGERHPVTVVGLARLCPRAWPAGPRADELNHAMSALQAICAAASRLSS